MIIIEEKRIQKRSIESREKITTAAWNLFCEKGFYNTNTKEIAKAAGVSVGNYYNYYKDKSELYYELSSRYLKGSIEGIEQLRDQLVLAEDKRLVIRDYIDIQMERAMTSRCFFNDCDGMIQKDPKLGELFLENTKKITVLVESFLSKVPEIKKRASYPVMAKMLVTMINSVAEDVCAPENKDISDEYREQLIEIVQDYLFGA